MSDLNGKSVLITGGLGFIGSNLAVEAVRQGAKVTIYDCLDPRSGGNLFNIELIKKDVEVIINDIRNFEPLCAAVINKDIIFSCAAYTSHPGAMKEPLVDIDVNCKGIINLLEAVKRFSPESRVVHVGTSTQIGKMRDQFVDELHCEFPMDMYSANKSASEKYVLIYGSAYNLKTSVIRLANNYGPRSSIKSADFGFINYFVGLALQQKDITIYGDGKQLRNFSFIEDSVQALIQAAVNDKAIHEVLFAVADKQYSVAEVATLLTEIIGGNLKFIEWPKDRAAIEVGDAIISNSKITTLLDWRPQVSLEAGIRQTNEFYESCLSRYL